MDTNFICSIGLITLALSTLLAMVLLCVLKEEPHRELLDKGIDCASANKAIPRQVEDGDIMLGNSLSCMLIQIDVAKKYSKKSPEIALNALQEAETLAQQSLGQLRMRRRSHEMSHETSALSSNELSKIAL